jgi:hypothetical protein
MVKKLRSPQQLKLIFLGALSLLFLTLVLLMAQTMLPDTPTDEGSRPRLERQAAFRGELPRRDGNEGEGEEDEGEDEDDEGEGDLVAQVIRENPPEERGEREEWGQHVGWGRKEESVGRGALRGSQRKDLG